MPYDPNANPYILNPKELPSNQVAAAAVPAKNIGTANQWSQSPYYLPNWGDESQTAGTAAAQATSPVATAAVTRPDATIDARDIAANQALNAEKTRQTSLQTGATSAITAINNLTGGAPGVASVSPNTTLHGVAITVTIMGSGFSVSAPTVNIGGACTAVTVVNDGELTCSTPAASVAGAANVAVTTSAGTGTLTGGMTYT